MLRLFRAALLLLLVQAWLTSAATKECKAPANSDTPCTNSKAVGKNCEITCRKGFASQPTNYNPRRRDSFMASCKADGTWSDECTEVVSIGLRLWFFKLINSFPFFYNFSFQFLQFLAFFLSKQLNFLRFSVKLIYLFIYSFTIFLKFF